MAKPLALIIDDSRDDIELIAALVRSRYDVESATTCAAGLEFLADRIPDIVLLDLRFPGGENGLEALRDIKAVEPNLPVLMVTESTATRDAVECIKAGAFHFVEKETLSKTVLLSLMARAISQRRDSRAAASALAEARESFGEIVGRSVAVRELIRQIEQVAPTDAAVLITGESGTGKELVARRIHAASRRRDRQLVTVACPAIAGTLMESEFFGVARGAFTGAVPKEGRFELAHGGTIFLDEVGDIQVDLQPKLLRVLEEGTFERVGDRATLRVDVRVISATSKDLAQMAREGTFRSELLHRLNTYPIRVPPLRERLEDVPLLVEHFASRYAARLGKAVPDIPEDVMEELQAYDWSQNNVRELRNAVEAALIRCSGNTLRPSHFVLGPDTGGGRIGAFARAKEECLADFERDYIVRLLRLCGGNITKVARQAGLSRRAVYAIMMRRGIDPAKYRCS